MQNPWVDVSSLNPNKLDEQAENAWMARQQDLYCTYVKEGQEEGKDLYDARSDALVKSFEEASGFQDNENVDCFPNMVRTRILSNVTFAACTNDA